MFSAGLELSQAEWKSCSQKKHWPQAMTKGTTTRRRLSSFGVAGIDIDHLAHEFVAEDVA